MLVPAVLAAFLRTMTGAMAAGLTAVTGVSVSGETCALIEPRLFSPIRVDLSLYYITLCTKNQYPARSGAMTRFVVVDIS